MTEKPTVEEMRVRILCDVQHHAGRLPEKTAIAWSGYLAALIEWGLLSVSEHQSLCALLPKIEANPVVDILLGRSASE